MPKFFEDLNRKEFFNPSLLGIFTNPYFFIKKGIYKSIEANAKYMKGFMLDFGCGSKPYRSLFCVDQYIGLDIENSGHDHRNSQFDVLYDGKIIPFADNIFDSVLSAEVFEHVFDLDEIVRELFRVMKPDAHILITVPFIWEEHEIPNDYVRFTSYGIIALLKKQGFHVVYNAKSSNYVEACFQIWIAYVSQHILPKNKLLKPLLITGIISPMTMLAILFSRLLPEDKALYLNNIIVARK